LQIPVRQFTVADEKLRMEFDDCVNHKEIVKSYTVKVKLVVLPIFSFRNRWCPFPSLFINILPSRCRTAAGIGRWHSRLWLSSFAV